MKICLIGSSRFIDQYREVNRQLTLAGHIVYTIAAISTQLQERVKAEEVITLEEKETLDLVHLRKIQESNVVVLISDETGYYGESTRREIKWAQILGLGVLMPDDLLGEYRRPVIYDLTSFVKARYSKDPKAMDRYYQESGMVGSGMAGSSLGSVSSMANLQRKQ